MRAQVQGLEESLTGLKSEVGGLRMENGDLSRHLSEEQAKTIRSGSAALLAPYLHCFSHLFHILSGWHKEIRKGAIEKISIA